MKNTSTQTDDSKHIADKDFQKWLYFYAITILTVLLIVYIQNIIIHSVLFQGIATNGPFQMLNPLRRIADGQYIDFFHGKGMPYLHYPLFWLFGGTLQASEISRYWVSFLFFIGTTLWIAHLALKNNRQRFYFVTAFFVLATWFAPSLMEPLHTIMGVRSTMVVVVFGVLLTSLTLHQKSLVVGLCTAAAFFISSEQGIALFGALFLTYIVVFILKRKQFFSTWTFPLYTTLATIIGGVGIFFIFNGSLEGVIRNLRYNFIEVQSDQFWYFGAPPNGFISNIPQLVLGSAFLLTIFMVLIMVVIVIKNWLKTDADENNIWNNRHVAYLMILFYGLITPVSYLGLVNNHYFAPSIRSIGLVGLILIFERLSAKNPQKSMQEKPYTPFIRILQKPFWMGVITIVLIAPSLTHALITWGLILVDNNSEAKTYPYLNHYWNEYLVKATSVLENHRKDNNIPLTLWSNFSGLLHTHYNLFNPVEDYMFHVLGDARRDSQLETFRTIQPEFVEMIDYYWLIDRDWRFHEELVLNYRAIGDTVHSVFWQRTDNLWRFAGSGCQAEARQFSNERWILPVTTASDGKIRDIVIARVMYEIENPLAKIPILGSLPRYIVLRDKAPGLKELSLPPRQTVFEFPVLFVPNQQPEIIFDVRPTVGGASLVIKSVCIRTLPADADWFSLYRHRVPPYPF